MIPLSSQPMVPPTGQQQTAAFADFGSFAEPPQQQQQVYTTVCIYALVMWLT